MRINYKACNEQKIEWINSITEPQGIMYEINYANGGARLDYRKRNSVDGTWESGVNCVTEHRVSNAQMYEILLHSCRMLYMNK